MVKRLQNKISESRTTLPIVAIYGTAIWMADGLYPAHMWIQFACFVLSTYLMMELNNSNALIRVYSRMVSCSFIALAAMCCFLFDAVNEAAAATFVTASYLPLFHSYQDKTATGRIFYGFMMIGLSSLFYVHTLFLVPAMWIVMIFYLQTMSRRTFLASVIGVVTPYWFATLYYIYSGGIHAVIDHFLPLGIIVYPPDYSILSVNKIISFAFIAVLAVIGIIHFIRTAYNDKIRIRMLYNIFIFMALVVIALTITFPQHYDILTRILIINTAPLIGHFISLTNTRVTNAVFCAIVIILMAITGFNLWTSLLLF